MAGRSAFLSALKTRLEKITTANGYSLTVNEVKVDNLKVLSIDVPAIDCPIIEIIQGDAVIEPEHRKEVWVSPIFLRLVAAPDQDDAYMENFVSAVHRCIMTDSATGASTARGATMQSGGVHTNTTIKLRRVAPDLGLIDANRVYVMLYESRLDVEAGKF